MKIVYAASEAVPFAKTGGLADVAGALPAWLNRLQHKAILVIPCYKTIDRAAHGLRYRGSFDVPFNGEIEAAGLYEGVTGDRHETPVYCISNPAYFNRNGLYQEGGKDYEDNAARFGFFNRAILEMCRFLSFKPDLVHCNDWQTGLVPAYLKTLYADDPFFARTAALFTIHNLAYQGRFDPGYALRATMLPHAIFNVEGVELWGAFSFIKGGIYYADALNTVSDTHKKEIQTEEYGFGLHGLLRTRSGVLHGIMNGVDYSLWDPEHDPYIAENYTPHCAGKKSASRKEAMRRLGLTGEADSPLVVIISRLSDQKGFELFYDIRKAIMERDLMLAVLGTGEPRYHQLFDDMARESHGRVKINFTHDEELAHLLYAAADIFLMPSRYEPCGLGQLIAMKYGALPVVRETGGLADSVLDYDAHGPKKGNGFTFREYSAGAMLERIDRALTLYRDKNIWNRLMANAMTADFGWESTAKKYMALYKRAINTKKKPGA
ncbi:MAG: glycogen synthase GlgA [Spirochaetes bacterium]|nr:glycogen synthase GlgA [Spirochaetota bacterium]